MRYLKLLRYLLIILTIALSVDVSGQEYVVRISGEKVVFLGDSNTWIGGDDNSKPEGWNYWFVKDSGPEWAKSYARSGATWTHTADTKTDTEENIGILGDNNVLYNQVCRLREDLRTGAISQPSLIIALAGTNDAWFLDKRPDALTIPVEALAAGRDEYLALPPNKITGLLAAIRYDIELLREACPEAGIVLVAPMLNSKAPDSVQTQVNDLIETAATIMEVKVIRLDKAGLSAPKGKPMTKDGVHTTKEGAKVVGDYILNNL